MADQTVRTIYEARVAQAQRGLTDLARDTNKAADSADKLDKSLDNVGKRTVKPKIDIALEQAEKDVKRLRDDLDKLEKMDADVRVEADVQAAQSDLDKAEAKLKALQGAKAEMIVSVDADKVEADLDGMSDAAADAGAEAGDRAGSAIMDGLKNTPVVGIVAGLVAAVGIGVVAGLKTGFQYTAMEDFFGARMGLDEGTARKYGAAAASAYSDAWGDSIEENLRTAQAARGNALIGDDSTGREIQNVISQLTAVSEILDADIPEAAEAAGNMIKSGLAENAEEAFDIIVTGAQNGMNRSGDLLDTLREYSGMFESLGLSGAEALGLVDQMMQAGARNSDVAADALKEFSIRAQDDSKTTRAAFEEMGLNADEMGEKFAKGGETAKEGLDTVLDGLRGIEDPMERNAAGVALFGTMWEDMGNGAALLGADLDDLGDSWVNVGDTSASAMDRMQDNAATSLEKAKRTVSTTVTTFLGGMASTVEEPLADLGTWVSTHTADILGFLIDLGYGFFDVARAAVEFAATTIEVMGDAAGAMDGIIDGVGKAVEAFGHLTKDQDMIDFGLSIQGAADDMTTFSENADGMADTLRNDVGGALDSAEEKFTEFTGPALMQAAINDAVTVMMGRLDEFSAHVDDTGGTVKINGETLGAEDALNEIIGEVEESNGTVTINGETVLAEDALDRVMDLAAEGAVIEFTANTDPVESSLDGIMTEPVTVPVHADTAPAEQEVSMFSGVVTNGEPPYVPISADTAFANEELELFYAAMQDQDWTVEINGNTVDAQTALDVLVDEINAGEGTVMINGIPTDAETALLQLISHINGSGGTVEIDGDAGKAFGATDSAVAHANGSEGTIDVDADTSAANSAINYAARDRTANIAVSYTAGSMPSRYASPMALGGQIAGYGGAGTGYGRVPGPSAPYGVDNVLWPSYAPSQPGRATGGPILSQPLAGGEWVVNPISSRQHDSLLNAINSGASRADLASMLGAGGGSIDSGAIGAAVSAAMSGWQPVVNIGDRELYGSMQRAERRFG